MCGDYVGLEHCNDHKGLLDCVKFALVVFFIGISLNGKDTLKLVILALVFYRPVEPDTNLFNLVVVCIKAGGFQVKGHSQELVVIVVALEITLAG